MTGEDGDGKLGEFHTEIISTEEICLIVPKSRHLQGVFKYGFRYPWIDIRQLESERFLMLNKGSRLRSVAEKVIKRYGIAPKIMDFSSIDTIWTMVEQDFGIALVSDFEPPVMQNVDMFSVGSKPITWNFIVVTRIGGYRSVPVQHIIDITKTIYGNKGVPEGR